MECNARKERGELVKLFTLPAVRRVIVALRTLNLNAQKDARYLGRRIVGVRHLGHENRGGALFAHVAAGRNESLRDSVPVRMVVQRVRQKRDQRGGHEQRALFGATRQNHVARVRAPEFSPNRGSASKRSTVSVRLTGEVSNAKAVVSSGVGGWPVRSSDTRRK